LDDLEQELARMLARSVDGLHPPVAVMVAEAGLRGRRMMLRRRLRIAGSVAAVAALAATAAVLGLPSAGRGGPPPARNTSATAGPATAVPADAAVGHRHPPGRAGRNR
jgi:hypothetical protein